MPNAFVSRAFRCFVVALAPGLLCYQQAAHARAYKLPELLELARRNNPTVAASAQQTAQIAAQLAEAERSRFPTGEFITMLAPAPRVECAEPTSTTLFPRRPGISDKEYREEYCYRTENREASLTDGLKGIFTRTEIKLVQPLYTFGKISAGIEAGKKGVAASQGREAATIAEIELNVKKAYWGVKAAREGVEIIKEGIGHIDEGAKKIEETIKDGEGAPTDRFRIQVARAEAEMRLAEAQRTEEFARNALRMLVGQPVGGDPNIDVDDEPLEALDAPKKPLQHYLDQAHTGRPEVLAMNALVAAKRSLADLEMRKMLPDLVLMGALQYAYTSSADNPVFAFASDPYNTFGAGLVLALRAPLDFGPKSARWTNAKAQAYETELRQQEAQGGVDLAVKKAYAEWTEASARREAVAKGEKAATRWLTAVSTKFEIGVAEAKDFSDALLPYFNYRLRALEATYNLNVAVATLSRETGSDVVATAK